MLRLLVVALFVSAASGCAQVTCRCQGGMSKYPSYPSIKSCQIPNSDDWVASFIEDDCTWNPTHEFPAGEADSEGSAGDGQYWLTTTGSVDANGDCTPPDQPCKEVRSKPINTQSGWFICKVISPKCWFDAGRVENTVWTGKYGCADNDLPKPAKAGDICKITCLAGFKSSGGPTVCRGGKWRNFPKCERMGCGTMPPKPSGAKGWKAPCTGNGPWGANTRCAPDCGDGWSTGNSAICKIVNGKPDWEPATCVKDPPPAPPPAVPAVPTPVPSPPAVPAPKPMKNCKKPDWAVTHGTWGCNGAADKKTCHFTCKAGFTPAGQQPICNGKTGKWDQSKPNKMHAKTMAHCACKPFQHIGPLTPPACIFGGYSGIDKLIFVADVSGSMRAGMKAGGKSYTRIAYLKIAMKDAIDSLADGTQWFNIIKYSTTCSGWRGAMVVANAANKKSGDTYVNGFAASGGTNMHCGLVLAEKDTKVEAIFLLTDGEPTIRMKGTWSGSATREGNRRDPYAIIRTVVSSSQWRKSIKIYPISFYAPSRRWKDMQWLATKTGGKFHKIV